MNLFSFSRLFAKLGQRRSERKPQRGGRRTTPRLFLEALEDRTLLSSTPAAVVTNPNAAFAAGFDPQVVMDPTNSQHLVEVSTTGSGLVGEVSINGGQTWKAFGLGGNVGDPTTFNGVNFSETSYPMVTSPSVAFDRDGNFYVVSNMFNVNAQTQAASASDLASGATVAGASGAIVFDAFNFSVVAGLTTGTAEPITNTVLYQWEGQDPAYNPTVAVDANLPATASSGPSFTDPVTGAIQTDTMAVSINPTTGAVVAPGASGAVPKGIYVGWNINFTNPAGIGGATSRIMIAASGDGGNNFTTNQYADANGGVGSAPQILFTQGTTASAAAAPTITFTTPATSVAAGQLSGTITIHAAPPGGGGNGNFSGLVVNLGASDSTGVFYDSNGNIITSVVTGTNGNASFLYEDAAAGTPTLTVSDAASGNVFAQQAETVTAGFADTITFTSAATTTTAGQQSGPITILVENASGAAVAGLVVNLSSTSPTGTFYNSATGVLLPKAAGVPYVITNASGNASFLYEDATAGTPTLTATDAANKESGAQTESVNAAAAAHITFTTTPVSVTAGRQSGTITIKVTNSATPTPAPVTNEVVFLSSTSSTGMFYNSATGAALPTTAGGVAYVVTNSSGLASFLYEDATVGSPTLKATDSANIAVTATQMETVSAGVAASITFTTTDTSAIAGRQSGPNTILVKNASSNPVAGELVNLSSTSTTGVFFDSNGNVITSVITNSGGQASFFYEDTTAPGTPTLTAADAANSTVTGTQTETVGAGVANTITFTTSDTTANAGQQSGPNTILVEDASSNPVAGEVVNLSSTSGTGVFYDSTGTKVITSVITNSSGQASFFYEDTTVGTPILTAAAAANPTVKGTQTETVGAGIAAAITFTTSDTTANAGQQSGPNTILVENASSAPVAGELVNLSSASPTGTFYDSNGNVITSLITNSSGLASFYYEDTANGTPILTAAAAANPAVKGTQTETVGAGIANTITFTTSDTTANAGQQSGPNTILVEDASSNPVAGEVVNLSSTSATGVFYDSTGTKVIHSVITNASGKASFLYKDATVGTPILTAADAAIPTVKGQQTETVSAGVANTITFTTPATTANAGQQSGPNTILVENASSAPVAGELVNLSSSSATGVLYDSNGNVITSVITNSSGQASFYYEDTANGTPILTAADAANPAVKGTQTETVTTGVAITFLTSPVSVPAGRQSGPITLQVEGASSHPVAGEVVYLSSTSSTGMFYNSVSGAALPTMVVGGVPVPYVVTNSGGQVSFLYEDVTAGSPILTATDAANPTVQAMQTETVSAGVAIAFLTSPVSVPAGQQSGPITIQAINDLGAGVPNEVVYLSSTSATGVFYSSTGSNSPTLPTTAAGVPYVITNSSGQATFFYEDSAQGTPTLTATDAAAGSVSKTQTETVIAGVASTITFTTAAVTVTAGRQSGTITIQVKNGSVVVPDEVVFLRSNSGTGTFFNSVTGAALPTTAGGFAYVITNSSGNASFLYEDAFNGSPVLTATDAANPSVKGTQTETVGGTGGAATITFTTAPTTATAGQEAGPITIQVKNVLNASLSGEVVDLSSASTTGMFFSSVTGAALPTMVVNGVSVAYVVTNSSGNASFLYEDVTSGTPTLTATDAANPTTTTVLATQTETVTGGGAPTVPGGQMNIVYTNDAGGAVIQQSQPDGGLASHDVAAAATFTDQNVGSGATIANATNNAGKTQTWVLAQTLNAGDGDLFVTTQNDTTNNLPPPSGTFNVTINTQTLTITSTDVGGNNLEWAIAGVASVGEGAGNTITYTQPSSGSTPVTSNFNLTVGSKTAPNSGFPLDFTTIDDLEVTLDVVYPVTGQLSIVLVPPKSSGLASITLLGNYFTGNSNDPTNPGQGLPTGANLGTFTDFINGPNNPPITNNVGTVFDSDAPRAIEDASASGDAPWASHFQPETFALGNSGALNEVDGLTPSQVDGTWTLQITEYVYNSANPLPSQFLNGFSMHFSSLVSTTGFGTGADGTKVNGVKTGDPNYAELGATRNVSLAVINTKTGFVTAAGALPGSPSNVYPTNASPSTAPGTTAGGTPGTGPGLVAAIDNTLGSFSPYEGRIYLAYVGLAAVDGVVQASTDTNIYLIHSDTDGVASGPNDTWNDTANNPAVQVNDDTAADDFSQGNRPMFLPSIAVDPITGTVVVDYYDGRWDASELRVANSISYSVDGGSDFSTSAPMNELTTATDAITGDTVVVAPIPGNQGQAGTLGFGDRAGLVVYDGDVIPFFGSNLNTTGAEVMTADVTIPSGPTVVSGDMGPVVNDFTYQPTVYDSQYSSGPNYAPITYNNVFATAANAPYPVGTRGLSSFVVTFDRPVDISTFTTSQIQVWYESTTGVRSQIALAAVNPIQALDSQTAFGPDLVGLGVLATQFLITLVAPQFAVGTYSYAIGLPTSTPDGALVSDDIRSVPTGIADNAGPKGTATVSGSSKTVLLGSSLNKVFAVPNPVLGTAFQAPYNSTTLPLIIPGPHVVSTAAVTAGGNITTTADNEVLNSTATGILVTFDRDMNPSTFTAAAVLQMTGPLGAITGPFTIVNGQTLYSEGLVPLALENRVFEITFPTQSLNGTYTLSIAPTVEDTNGNAVDTNLNAGLDVLEGTNPTNTVVVSTTYPNSQPVTLPPTSGTASVTSTINITDAFTIAQPTQTWTLASPLVSGSSRLTVAANGPTPPPGQFTVIIDNEQLVIAANTTGTTWTIVQRAVDGTTQPPVHNAGADVIYTGNQIQLQLDITPASNSSTLLASDLQAQLISPSGTVIQLFTNVGQGDTPSTGFPESEQEFNFTTFDDFATTPIQNATPPFASTYNPQQPLSALDGQSTAGTWKLVITNTSGTATDIGTLNSWSLTFPHAVPDTGLGQGVGEGDADQISASFRIFNENPTNSTGSEQWTAVGPAADNNSTNTGPVNAIAVDPSDPSGNTVYVASASGGLWKTTDFLTTNPIGPTYVPLINLGPTGSLNISSIAVFGRNNDPAQSVIYAITGNPNNVTIPGNIGTSNDNAAGIGLLRSEDGGQTWEVLDSSTNVYTSSNGGTATLGQSNTDGNPLPEMDPTATPTAPRDYLFVGLVGYQVTVDPTPLNGQIVVYAAFSNGTAITTGGANNNGGLYRSEDGGNTWALIQSGNATSVALAAGSGDAFDDTNRNLEILYAGFAGTGVFYTNSATSVGTGGLTQLNQPQYPGRFVATLTAPHGFASITNSPIPTSASGNPNGAFGRIVLATPALTSSPVDNLFYQGWVYAAVANAAGTALQGLYVSKDYTGTWTEIQLPEYLFTPGLFTEVFGTNNSDNGDINTLANNQTAGALNLTLVVDPTDPEIVYLGGGGSNLLRIDISNLSDPYAMVGYNNIAPGASGATSVQTSTTGPASVNPASFVSSGPPYGELNTANNTIEVGASGNSNFYNLYHNALNPFLSSGSASTPYLVAISNFNNQGTGALWGEIGNLTNNQGVSILSSSLDMRALVAITDPLTGETRLLVGDDNGIYTGTDQSVTAIQSNIGAAVEVTGSRNGNLQLADMADSAAQPSSEAAVLAGALLYGDSQFNNGFPDSPSTVSAGNVFDTGNLNWTGVSPSLWSELNNMPVVPFSGDGEAFATDQTGTGVVFQDRWGNTTAINQYPYNDANFFLKTPPGSTPQSITSGISNLSDQGAEFPANGGSRFAVNPVNPDDLLISSQTGKLYLSTTEGNQWGPLLNFNSGGSYANALAFGASNSTYSFQSTDASFLYAGTTSGNIYVSLTAGTTWYQTTGLAGAGAIEQIVTDPTQGSYDAFAVTQNGVYYLKNIVFNTSTGAVTSAVWTPITGNLFSQTRPLFNNPNNPYPTLFAGGLTSIAVDWRFAVPTSNTAYASNTWTLASALSATTPTSTTLTVNAGGPTPPTTPFFITIGQEVLEVTATNSTTNVWTVLRAQDGTTEAAHTANAPVTTNGAAPVLYVGGDGGVFRSEDGGTTWTNFPNVTDTWTLASALTATATTLTVAAGGPTAPTSPFTITIGGEELEVTATNSTTNVWTVLRAQDGTTAAAHSPVANDITNNGDNAVQQGGLLPDMQVTSLQLVNGDINASTGLPNGATGSYNMLVASTYGQGDFAIHLDNSAVLNDVVPQLSLAGPQVVSVVAATTNGGTTLTGITITFNSPVDSQTLLAADINVYDPNGALLAVQSVTEISTTEYQVVFQQSDSTLGIYSVNIANATDNAGDVMTPYSGKLAIPTTTSEAVFDFPVSGPGAGVYVYRPGTGFEQLLPVNASVLAINANGDVAAEFQGYGVYRYTAATGTWTLLTPATASLLAIDNNGDVFADLSQAGGIYELFSPTSNRRLTVNVNPTVMAVDAAGDLTADFTGYGLQELFAGHTAFTPLYSTDASLVAMDAAGDIFFDLPGYGVFRQLSTSPGSAQRLNPVDASLLSADAAGDLTVQFPGYGIYRLASGASNFVQLTTNSAASSLAIGGPAGDVFAEFQGSGVYRYTTATNAFTQITLNNVSMPAEDANGDVFADVSGQGVYRNTLAGGWQQLNPVTPTLTAVDAAGDVAVYFSGYGVYILRHGASSFTQLTSASASALAIDNNGDVFADLAAAGGIYELTGPNVNKKVGPASTVMTVDGAGDLFADFQGYGVQELKAGAASFIVLNGADATLLAADAAGDLTANFTGYGVYKLAAGAAPSQWQRLNGANASQLAIDGNGDVFVEFAGYAGVYRYVTPSSFQQITAANVSLLTDDLAGDVFVDFANFGFYRYTPGNGFQLTMGAEGDASLLV